jgi:tetratricopeptide (TPR) repeat protein
VLRDGVQRIIGGSPVKEALRVKPPSAGPDPRPILFGGILGLLAIAVTVRYAVGPAPPAGFRINRAIALSERGYPELAWKEMRVVLAARPEDPTAWLRAGRALRALGRLDEAAVHFQRAAELDPRSETIRFELARALDDAGLPLLAEQAADEALALQPEHAGAVYLKASLAAGRGERERALELLARALDLGLLRPDRYRFDPRFDAMRNDRAFAETVLPRRVPGVFREEG